MPFLLDDRYEVTERRLGGGAFGDIWLGYDRKSGAEVAIKIAAMPSAGITAEDIDEAFTRERAILNRVRHPNVVSLVHAGGYESRRFLVLEYAGEQSLWDVIKQEGSNPKLPVSEKIRILCDVSRALGKVHAAGYVHLDVKPENILIAPDGRAVLIDFGSCLSLDEAKGPKVEPETEAYCSPEQIPGCRWCDGKGLSARTDVFAFGIVAWEWLSLQRPFGEADGGHLQRIAAAQPKGSLSQMAPGCPADIVSLVLTCLSKNPQGRPSMAVVAQRLDYAFAILSSQSLHQEGRVEEALRKAEEAIAIYPELQPARDLAYTYSREYVDELLQSGESVKAEELLRQAREYCLSDQQRLEDLEKLEEQINAGIYKDKQIRNWVDRAIKDRDAGNLSAAAEYLAMAERLDPQHPALKEYYGARRQQLSSEIDELLRVPDYPAALSLWKSMMTEAQEREFLRGNIVDLQRLRKKIWKQAEIDVEDALFRNDFPFADSLCASLGQSVEANDQDAQSRIESLRQMVNERKAGYANATNLATLNEMSEGRYEDALARVRSALQVLPDDTNLLAAEARLVGDLSQTREIENSIRQKIQNKAFETASSMIHENRATNRLPEDVLDDLENQLRSERSVGLTILQSEHLVADGRLQDAIDLLERALRECPSSTTLLNAKSDLESRAEEAAKDRLAAQIAEEIDHGELDHAMMDLRQAEARFPRDPKFVDLSRKAQDAKRALVDAERKNQQALRDDETQKQQRGLQEQAEQQARERRAREQEQEQKRQQKTPPVDDVKTENARRIEEARLFALAATEEFKFDKAREILDNCRRQVGNVPELTQALRDIDEQERAHVASEDSGAKLQGLFSNQPFVAVAAGSVVLILVVVIWLSRKPTPNPTDDAKNKVTHSSTSTTDASLIGSTNTNTSTIPKKTDSPGSGVPKPFAGTRTPPPATKLPAEIVFFQPNRDSVPAGENVRLSWKINHATAAAISPGIGVVNATGDSKDVNVSANTTYKLTAVGEDGQPITKETAVSIIAAATKANNTTPNSGNTPSNSGNTNNPGPQPAVITSFTADPPSVRPGESTILRWTTNHAKAVVLGEMGSFPANGQLRVSPKQTQIYMIQAIGEIKNDQSSTLVTVQVPAPQQNYVPQGSSDSDGIHAALNKFSDACEKSNLNELRQVSPDMTAAEDNYYRARFTSANKIRLQFTNCAQPNIASSNQTATIACTRTQTDSNGGNYTQAVVVSLRKTPGGSWVMQGQQSAK